MSIDLSFYGRETARNPVALKSAREIEHDATWSTLRDDAIFVGGSILGALVAWALAVLVFAL